MSDDEVELDDLRDVLTHTLFALVKDEPGVIDLHELPDIARRVVDERDRLKAEVGIQTDAADAGAEAVGAMAEKVSATLAENQRLRAVVDAVMEALGDEAPAKPEWLGDYLIGLVAEWEALHAVQRAQAQAFIDRQLDASPTGEDT